MIKVCFSFQRNFTRLQHAIAVEMKKRGIATRFCGYCTSFKSEKILKEQNEIEYGTLISDDEMHELSKKVKLDMEYLKNFEAEYGIPNLWPYILSDRCVMRNVPKEAFSYNTAYDHEGMLKLIQVMSKTIIKMLEHEKPDIVIFPLVGSMGVQLLYEIAKKRGLKTLFLNAARIDDRVLICDNAYNDFTNILKHAKPTDEDFKEARKFLKRFTGEEEVRYDGIFAPKKVSKPLRFLWKEISGYFDYVTKYWGTQRYLRKNKMARDYTLYSPYYYTKNRLKRLANRLTGHRGLFVKPDFNEDYSYFPLHVEPEVAIQVWAPYYDNQIEICRTLAKALPVGQKLYVKEHPNMLYERPVSYYKKLLRIPNVKLIDPFVGSQKVVRNSKSVFTITGTAGMEAFFMGKPVLSFGSVMYNAIPSIKKIGKIHELPFDVKDMQENYKFKPEEAEEFVAKLYSISKPLSFGKIWFEWELGEIRASKDFEAVMELILPKL
ncbi:hypothetical protein HY463_00965 [Candidatus Peregrinibacteria bacterium]|nr:hypothetical protein [Candidatus Peregrinibacteria bacterium]